MTFVFTLWPEWRDYDQYSTTEYLVDPQFGFYLVTWMKGLRPSVSNRNTYIELSPFLPCDLNEGITTYIYGRIYTRPFWNFYLVTWMKGLRLLTSTRQNTKRYSLFLPCDLNEGITTFQSRLKLFFKLWFIFTLWPEWRDYDLPNYPAGTLYRLEYFYLVTWMKGLRPSRRKGRPQKTALRFLPCDLNEGITTYLINYIVFIGLVFIFTLWPEWRDYDRTLAFTIQRSDEFIFTLWPEWRDYDRLANR